MTSFVSYGQSHKGLVRQLNEDACLLLPEYGVWVVADGMGGHAAGDIASQLVVDTLGSEIQCAELITAEVIKNALLLANQRVVEYCQNKEAGEFGGSTVVVLWLNHDKYHVFWLGDSRLYLLRTGILQQITKDHSQVNDMVESGLISESEAESHHLANVITRAIGIEGGIDIAILSGPIVDGDVFLLCSDGLNKELTDDEIKRFLLHADVEAAGKALIHTSLLAGARDNVTSVLVKVTDVTKTVINTSYSDNICTKTIPMSLRK